MVAGKDGNNQSTPELSDWMMRRDGSNGIRLLKRDF
jgi:hypothetical protein